MKDCKPLVPQQWFRRPRRLRLAESFGFLVGQTMRQLKGKADPKVVNQVIRAKLEQL